MGFPVFLMKWSGIPIIHFSLQNFVLLQETIHLQYLLISATIVFFSKHMAKFSWSEKQQGRTRENCTP